MRNSILSWVTLVCWCASRSSRSGSLVSAHSHSHKYHPDLSAIQRRSSTSTSTSTSPLHGRLRRKLSYHVEFQNVTWQHDDDDDDDETGTHQDGRMRMAPSEKEEERTMTLARAKIIHEYAIETTQEVRRLQRGPYNANSNSNANANANANAASTTCSSTISQQKDDPRINGGHNRRPDSPATLFFPVDYGADPLGIEDSTIAFENLVMDLLNITTARPMAAGIINLGGATIDLQGGHYLLSRPIVIPPMYGNAHLVDGTLQASPPFPPNRWLIEIGNLESCQPVLPDGKKDPQLSCNEFIDVTSVLLDANFLAAGGVRVSRAMGTVLTNVFVTGFVQVGILVSGGHEVMISNAWLAECYWSTNRWCQQRHSQSVGIRIDGMDHYLTNTIVFDFAKTGVEIRKPANLLEGVHTWNGGGQGIVIGTPTSTASSVRLIGCYLDFETLDIWDPSNVLVESTFFYHGHTVLHAGASQSVHGLTMRFNHYSTKQSVVLDGAFDSISAVSIQEEVDWVKTTKASQTLFQTNATEWTFDFSSELLFPTIEFVSYTLAVVPSNNDDRKEVFVSHMARPPNNGTTVTVVTSAPVDAMVYITVEQGL